jgi:hypothetical protein
MTDRRFDRRPKCAPMCSTVSRRSVHLSHLRLSYYVQYRATVERRLSALVGTEGGANNRFVRIIKQPLKIVI